jgi:hypothetical protein
MLETVLEFGAGTAGGKAPDDAGPCQNLLQFKWVFGMFNPIAATD